MRINLEKLLEKLPKNTTEAKKELIAFMGSKQKVYYRLQNPKAAITPDDIQRFAEFFQCDIGDLFEEENEKQDVMERHGLSK